jgi:hypothetical protein
MKIFVISEVDLDNLIRTKGGMFAGYQTLIDDIPLESLWALENLSDDRGVAGIGESG